MFDDSCEFCCPWKVIECCISPRLDVRRRFKRRGFVEPVDARSHLHSRKVWVSVLSTSNLQQTECLGEVQINGCYHSPRPKKNVKPHPCPTEKEVTHRFERDEWGVRAGLFPHPLRNLISSESRPASTSSNFRYKSYPRLKTRGFSIPVRAVEPSRGTRCGTTRNRMRADRKKEGGPGSVVVGYVIFRTITMKREPSFETVK